MERCVWGWEKYIQEWMRIRKDMYRSRWGQVRICTGVKDVSLPGHVQMTQPPHTRWRGPCGCLPTWCQAVVCRRWCTGSCWEGGPSWLADCVHLSAGCHYGTLEATGRRQAGQNIIISFFFFLNDWWGGVCAKVLFVFLRLIISLSLSLSQQDSQCIQRASRWSSPRSSSGMRCGRRWTGCGAGLQVPPGASLWTHHRNQVTCCGRWRRCNPRRWTQGRMTCQIGRTRLRVPPPRPWTVPWRQCSEQILEEEGSVDDDSCVIIIMMIFFTRRNRLYKQIKWVQREWNNNAPSLIIKKIVMIYIELFNIIGIYTSTS